MKTYFISIVLITSMCLNLSSSGQDTQKKPNVWAFIIGVSEYKNLPDNLQLEFADKDAQSIASFLSDNLLIKESNIITHYNADASKPIIDKDLYNLLLKKAKPGDIVFLYFACHGDIDSKLDDGFFLMHDVSLDVDYFLSDAVRISTIQYLVQKAAEDSIRVVMISDACRSGKMIGTPGGAKSTLTALIQDWNNVFKLVSCQPNESSFEGTHWGGGHGVFSFYLLTGMMGLADENGDNTIQFGELFDYVKNNVKKDTEYGQTPKASGNESFALMKVNPEAKIMAAQMIEDLEPLKSDKKRGRGLVTPIPKDQKLLADSFRYFIQHNIIANPKSCRAYNCCKVVFTEEKTSALSNPLSGRPIIDNQIVWFVEPDKLLKKIDLNSLELAEFAHPLKTLPPDALFTKKGNLLVISQSSEISVFDVATGKKVSRIKSPHTGSTTFIQFLSEKILITFGKDNLLKLWDVQTGSSVSSITIPAMVAQGITFDKDHSYGYLYGDNKKVFTIDLANYINFSELKTPGKTISDIIYNSDFSRFFAYDPKGLLMLYRTNGNSLIKTYKVNAKPNQLHWFEHNIVFLNKSGKISVLNTINDSIYATTIKPGEKIFINNNSLISISDKKLTSFQIRYEPDLVSAINVLEKIRALGNFPADDFDKLSGELLAASFRIIQPVINGILNGEEVPPGIDTVQYAQELAIYLTSLFDENIITGDLQAINVFLEAYLSILKNETQKYDYCYQWSSRLLF
ncbi:MAG: caspase family protein [Bacteroidetes bacterium]|nr:caspase family protein [Bacteroidota bacterium]